MMKGRKSLIIGAVLLLMVGGVLATSAYNLFVVERDTTMNVVSDDTGILALNPGPSEFVYLNNGELQIDVTSGGAAGQNVNSELHVGDESQPTTTPAFSVTNNHNAQREILYEYTNVVADSVSDDNVHFQVYDGTGTSLGEFNESSSLTVTGVGSGATHYIVLNVTTHQSVTSDDLSGTVRMTAS